MISTMPKWIGDLLEGATGPRVRVLETIYITHGVKKIRFQGNITKINFLIGGASVIRVSDTEYRNYTPAFYNIPEGSMELVFHIHGNGVGSRYIDNLQPGDELHISMPRGRKVYDPYIKQYFIFGDETSLGMACSLMTELKRNHHQFEFYFELDEENSGAPRILGLENVTVIPKDKPTVTEQWVHHLPVLQNGGGQPVNFILTGNVNSVQTFRKSLKGKNTGKIYSQGYWLEGKKGL